MKIGILTFSNAYNFGAALQAYSLQKALEEMEHDAELIDYRCAAIEKMHKLKPVVFGKIRLKVRLYNLIYNVTFFKRRLLFKKFQKQMHRSKKYTIETIAQTNHVYDLFISGSDQVFNLKLTGEDSTFFLDFVETGVKASYAASIGVYFQDKQDLYKSYLESFQFLSLREITDQNLIQSELGIQTEIMPDPVFLHTREEWKSLLHIKEKTSGKYILVYALIENRELYWIAKKIAEENGYKVYVITKALKPMGEADKFFRNIGPRQFLDLIANASYIVTNSFHGTAFSIIFEKPFSIVLPTNAPNRIKDLLAYFDLTNRIYDNSGCQTIIDYGGAREKKNHLCQKGLQYLKKITDNRR